MSSAQQPITLEDNMGLVFMVARQSRRYLIDSKLDFDDLISWGTLGLGHAVSRFDPEKGSKFSTYACVCIRGYILSGMRSLRREVWRASERGQEIRETAIDGLSGSGPLLSDHGVGWSKVDDQIWNRQVLTQIWPHISRRQRRIMELVLYSGMDQTQIGEKLGLSRAMVTLMYNRTVRKAREIFNVEEAA